MISLAQNPPRLAEAVKVSSFDPGDTRPGEGAGGRDGQLFDLVADPGQDQVSPRKLIRKLEVAGLEARDPRLDKTLSLIRALEDEAADDPIPLDRDAFRRVIQPSSLLVERALLGNLAVPDFASFSADIERLFEATRANEGGEAASYIPQLGRVDPDLFGLGLCTVDGQRLSLGDAGVPFSVQSSSKPISYSLALEHHGEEGVHRHVGREPSGQSFNELALNSKGLPHNPMINAGAIMSAALIRPDLGVAERFEYVVDMWTRLSGGVAPGFDNATYLSERRTADRNFALGYFLRENGAFPEGTDLLEVLDFYFQCCSLQITARAFSVVAATLANGGVCPLTGEVVFGPETVQKCLSLMYSCGMYDFSGEWAFSVGLPAKSGVSGAIVVVVPNVMGLAVWSPRLDALGNSVRGVEFCQRLVKEFNFHNYDSLVGGAHGKKDPRRQDRRARQASVVDLCWAASEGDLPGLRVLVAEGANPNHADYDGRTPLHLAAAEGQVAVVSYLLGSGVDPAPLDRWGATPLDDALRAGHEDVVTALEEAS
jgi:glutaminase